MRFAVPVEKEWAVVHVQTVQGKPCVSVLDCPKNGVLAREVLSDGDDQTQLFQQFLPPGEGEWEVEYTISWLMTGELTIDECVWTRSYRYGSARA
jgi:hypothetical protein